MDSNSKTFCHKLATLDVAHYLNSGDFGASDLELALYDLSDMLEGQELGDTLADIFTFYEKYPNIELGTPGPLVTLIEGSSTDYLPALLASLESRPTYVTVNILARVINTDIDESEKTRFLAIIDAVANHADADESARATAKEYLEHRQLTWGSAQEIS
jgi:hypothetical protein